MIERKRTRPGYARKGLAAGFGWHIGQALAKLAIALAIIAAAILLRYLAG